MFNNPNLDHVNINAYTIFGEILWICSKHLSRNEIMMDSWNDRVIKGPQYSPSSLKRGHKMFYAVSTIKMFVRMQKREHGRNRGSCVYAWIRKVLAMHLHLYMHLAY